MTQRRIDPVHTLSPAAPVRVAGQVARHEVDTAPFLPDSAATTLHRWARRERARRIGDVLAAGARACAAAARRAVRALVDGASGVGARPPTKRRARANMI